MATVKIFNTHKDLNECGCTFFINTSEAHVTRVTSTELRWLSIKTRSGEYISKSQETACEYIESVANAFGSKEWDKINMKILLYVNPVISQHEHIKKTTKMWS